MVVGLVAVAVVIKESFYLLKIAENEIRGKS
jgi:hypothetical protein